MKMNYSKHIINCFIILLIGVNMKLQKLYSLVRQAIDKYNMINENDKIAVGISGGKDSLTLLYALAGLKGFYPIKFEIVAITVDLGYEGFDLSEIQKLCQNLGVEYHIVETDIGRISMEKASEQSSPCSWCAKLRKGALNDKAKALGCNKIAYAHHMDDIIETMFMSLFYEGRFYSFPPVTYFEDVDMYVLRPMMYVSEAEVIGFTNKYNLPTVSNPCPYDGHTKREYIKDMVAKLNRENPGVKKRLFRAIENGNIEDWNLCIRNIQAD